MNLRGAVPLFPIVCLVLGAWTALAADKIRIEIVETTDRIAMLPRTIPGTPERIHTHCDASVAGNSASGDCDTVVSPPTSPDTVKMPSANHSAKAILPDGSHANLFCFPWDKGCGVITPMAPEKSSAHCEAVGGGTTCTTEHLGSYQAKRSKNELLIYTPSGKVRYQIAAGSW